MSENNTTEPHCYMVVEPKGRFNTFEDAQKAALKRGGVVIRCDDWKVSLGAEPSTKRDIFVFGSNLAGRHGAGAALDALLKWGAAYGKGEGLQGDSYAIPTKDEDLNTLSLAEIQEGVSRFLDFADEHPELSFGVTRIGCGLAGYKDEDIAPMFYGASLNVRFFEPSWERYR